MATRTAVQSGNWSDPATWDTGVPVAGDTADPAAFIVTIDQDIDIAAGILRCSAGAGYFLVDAARAITANIQGASAAIGDSRAVLVTAAAGTVTITGNITGGTQSNTGAVDLQGSCAVEITGNVTSGSGGNANAIHLEVGCSSNVAITGNVTGPTGTASSAAIYHEGTGTVTVTGNLQAGSGGSYQYALDMMNSSRAHITGNVTGGGATSYNYAIELAPTFTGTLTIVGDVTGGSLGGSNYNGGIWANACSGGTVHVTGSVTGGLGANSYAFGIYLNASPNLFLTVVGTVTGGAATSNHAVMAADCQSVTITGNCIGGGNANASAFVISSGTFEVTGEVRSKTGYAIQTSGPVVGTITGDHYADGGPSAYYNMTTGADITVTGDVYHTASATTYAVYLNGTGGDIAWNGSATGGTASSRHAVYFSGAPNLTWNGDITGGSGSSAYGILNYASGGVFTLNGTLTAGTGSNAHGMLCHNSYYSTTFIDRTVSNDYGVPLGPGTANYGIYSLAVNHIHYVREQVCGAGGLCAVVGRVGLWDTGSHDCKYTADDQDGNEVTLTNPVAGSDQADPTDVREDTVYASGNLTGTLAVPAAGSVALGVPVDDTVGTAVLTSEALVAVIEATPLVLSVPVAQQAAVLAGSTISLYRGDSITFSLSGLGNVTARSQLWFTAKSDVGYPDGDASLQITEEAGLLTLAGRNPAVDEEATLEVEDESAGDVTIDISAAAAMCLSPMRGVWDLQMRDTNGDVTTLAHGVCIVVADVTRRIDSPAS